VKRVLAVVAVWLVTLGVWRTVVALPERCPDASVATLTTTAERAVSWFRANQLDDGRWRYRVDVRTDADLGGYAWVRHAGVLLSLEQARARDVADRGWAAAVAHVGAGDVLPESGREVVSVGGTALLVAAGLERRDATSRTDLDELMLRLGAT
jgi:hypothetical protein